MGFKEIVLGIVIVGLFALSLITFGGQVAINNNASQNILDDPAISGFNETLRGHLQGIESSAQNQREVFENQEAQGGADEGFSLTSIVSISKTFIGTAISTFNLIFGVVADVLGIPPIVFNVILGGIIIVILIFTWRLIKAGGA